MFDLTRIATALEEQYLDLKGTQEDERWLSEAEWIDRLDGYRSSLRKIEAASVLLDELMRA